MINRFKIVLLATVFSILFEYSMRGIGGLFHRGIFLLFFLYLSYYSLVEDLIVKYKITNKQLIIIAFCFGVIPEAFLTGSIFSPPLYMGINISRFIFINFVWWGFLQGLVTFYFANRIVNRTWYHRKLNYFGWGIRIIYIACVSIFTFFASPVLPKGPVIGYIVVFGTIALGFIYIKKNLTTPQQDVYPFEQSYILDFLSFGSVIIFIILGTFVATTQALMEGSLLNVKAAQLSSAWTVVVFIGVIIYYLFHKKQITI
jgi:hypothetical protein